MPKTYHTVKTQKTVLKGINDAVFARIGVGGGNPYTKDADEWACPSREPTPAESLAAAKEMDPQDDLETAFSADFAKLIEKEFGGSDNE